MESLMLTIKFVMFYAFEVFVVATLGAVVIAGLVEVVQNRVRSARAVLTDALNS
jgi:Flp pilus assembly pilin Flp